MCEDLAVIIGGHDHDRSNGDHFVSIWRGRRHELPSIRYWRLGMLSGDQGLLSLGYPKYFYSNYLIVLMITTYFMLLFTSFYFTLIHNFIKKYSRYPYNVRIEGDRILHAEMCF